MNTSNVNSSVTILYFFDPLCGWCFGFNPVMKALHKEFGDAFAFRTVCGGMMIGNRARPIAEKAEYIRGAIPRLEQMCGVQFGDAYYSNILDNPSYISNSETPSRAIVALRSLLPTKAVHIAHTALREHFVDGMDYESPQFVRALAEEYSVDAEQLTQLMNSTDVIDLTNADFEFAQLVGVQSFPTVLAEIDSQYYILSQGYAPLQQLQEICRDIQANVVG